MVALAQIFILIEDFDESEYSASFLSERPSNTAFENYSNCDLSIKVITKTFYPSKTSNLDSILTRTIGHRLSIETNGISALRKMSTNNSKNIVDRVKIFTKKIERDANKHIYFDNSSDDDENEEGELGDNVSNANRAATTHHMYALVRNSVSDSFGFEVNGKKNVLGDHKISNITVNSIAHKCGLKINDKIKSINGVCVESLNIDELIGLIQKQTAINPFRIELVLLPVQDSDSHKTIAGKNPTLRKRNLCKAL